MAAEEVMNARAPSFFVMEGTRDCWSCKAQTAVVGLGLPRGFEIFEDGRWVAQEGPGIVFWVDRLAPNVVAQVQRINGRYRIDFSRKLKRRYWINHCEHCDAKLGDNYLYNEGKPPFGRMSPEDVAVIRFTHVKEPFLAQVDHFGVAETLERAMTDGAG